MKQVMQQLRLSHRFCMAACHGLMLGVLLLAGTGAARAEAPFALASTPGKLPKQVLPLDYDVHLTPDLEKHAFAGDVTIQVKVVQAVRRIVLNANELTITRAAIDIHGTEHTLVANVHPKTETLELVAPVTIQPGQYRLHIQYQGKINRQPYGWYYDLYPTKQGEKQILATEMEPTEARRLLPCWDEPVFRARFQISVVLPSHFKAISNTPIAKATTLGDGAQQLIRFQPTPKMPSYLLVLAAGELERTTAMQDGVEIGLVTTEGKQGATAYALASSQQLLAYYNQYFGVPYPLSKLDHIAVPNGYGGAMENWGGIIYTESSLLFDPAKDAKSSQREVFGITAHEMAHQWFGNLVTMAWWDNLWLNEGFASWMGTKATDHFNPEWHVWLGERGGKDNAMESDAQAHTHPIQQSVDNESEANDVFDGITYGKGQAFLRMLEQYLGEPVFQQGIRSYLLKHQYSNTTSADLWQALSQASGKAVAPMAKTWTTQPGFPLVGVTQQCQNGVRRITLSQHQFTESGATSPRLWQIPVRLQIGPESETVLLATRSRVLQRQGCAGLMVLDPQDLGFYRVQYTPDLMAELEQQWHTLPESARLKILADTAALVRHGKLPLARYLALVQAIGDEPRLAIWEQVFENLAMFNQFGRDQDWYPAWQRYWYTVLAPRFEKLGWEEAAGESEERRQLRAAFINALTQLDQPSFITAGQSRFRGWLKDPASMAVSIQDPVLQLVARNADQATYDVIRQLAQNALTTSERARYLVALTLVKDPALAQQTLGMLFDPKLPSLTFSSLLYGVASSNHLDLTWQFLQKNQAKLLGGQTLRDRNRLVPTVVASASDVKYADQMLAFVKANLPAEAMVEASRVNETIRIRARRKASLLPQMKAVL